MKGGTYSRGQTKRSNAFFSESRMSGNFLNQMKEEVNGQQILREGWNLLNPFTAGSRPTRLCNLFRPKLPDTLFIPNPGRESYDQTSFGPLKTFRGI